MDGAKLEISNIISSDILAGWDQNKTNPGATFLNGMSTSVFAASGEVMGAANSVMNMGSSVANVINTGEDLVNQVTQFDFNGLKDELKDAAISLVKDNLVTFSKDTINYIKQETTTAFTTYLLQRTSYWTAATSKTSVAEFLQDMLSPVDDKIQKAKDDMNDKAKQEKLEKVSAAIGELNTTVSTAISYAQTGMDTILKYVEAGPEYITNTLNSYINTVIVPVKQKVTSVSETIVAEMYGASEALAQQIGTTAGEKISAVTKNLAQSQKANIEKVKITVVSFAKGLLDLVKKKAMALIGM